MKHKTREHKPAHEVNVHAGPTAELFHERGSRDDDGGPFAASRALQSDTFRGLELGLIDKCWGGIHSFKGKHTHDTLLRGNSWTS